MTRRYKSGTRWCAWRWTDVVLRGELYLRRLHLVQTPWFSLMLHWIPRPDPRTRPARPSGVVCFMGNSRCLRGMDAGTRPHVASVEHTRHARDRHAPHYLDASRYPDLGPRRPGSPAMGLPHLQPAGCPGASTSPDLDFPVLGDLAPRAAGLFFGGAAVPPPRLRMDAEQSILTTRDRARRSTQSGADMSSELTKAISTSFVQIDGDTVRYAVNNLAEAKVAMRRSSSKKRSLAFGSARLSRFNERFVRPTPTRSVIAAPRRAAAVALGGSFCVFQTASRDSSARWTRQ